jgi:hypothetical protein
MICGHYFNGCIQNFLTFQAISSTRVCVEVYEGNKIGAQTGIFVLGWFLKDGSHEDFELML